MSTLIKKITVPDYVRKVPVMVPTAIEIYDDHVKAIGGQGGTWYYKDYMGVTWQAASVACAYACVVFTTPVNVSNYIQNGVRMLQDNNRMFFASGMFSYRDANDFALKLYRELSTVIENYKTNPPQETNANTSIADEIKKFNDLLKEGIITQDEFDTKKKQLMGL